MILGHHTNKTYEDRYQILKAKDKKSNPDFSVHSIQLNEELKSKKNLIN
jgi:hypothetical protein